MTKHFRFSCVRTSYDFAWRDGNHSVKIFTFEMKTKLLQIETMIITNWTPFSQTRFFQRCWQTKVFRKFKKTPRHRSLKFDSLTFPKSCCLVFWLSEKLWIGIENQYTYSPLQYFRYSVLQMGAKTGWNSTVDVSLSMSKFLLALSAFCLVVNSVATAPIYLCITPMRQALFKTSSQPTSNNQV